jgi:hypothetical protein
LEPEQETLMSTNPTTASARPAVTTGTRPTIAQAALYLGALSVLATGVVHIQQYYGQDYSTIPTIGTLFFLNFVGAVVITVGLIAPLGRVTPRYADAIRSLFALAGIGLGVLSLVALFVSEGSGLFGFVENGYRMPIVLAMVAEIAATVFLVVFLVASRVVRLPSRR